ncbi:hypothetical protein Sjap_017995 [Stephania japonica]|uniref:Transposase Tnp1/En/Spm-like domain-containing protein n=1 Tax=Stephania japonica TaxID=461633 RepID=A0AAP0I7A5_9MAGN
MKKKIVQHIGTLWRSWKSRVTSDLKQALEDGWSDDEINSKLQPEGVDLAGWFTFRKERESTAFKETSKKFKELRSKHKLPHTTSRKGYARLEEEMKAKSGKADISRADLWIEGHKNKKGQPHNDEIAGVVEKINECQRRSSASSSQSINKDPIAQVFGPEHQGRVRGLGFGVTPSNVRATTQSTILVRKLQADFRRLEEKHEQLAELIRSQQMPLSSRQQQNNPPNICGKKCMILDWLSPKKIVGEGEVETDDPMHLVDGIPIGGNAYLVYVDRVFEPNAFLWRNQNNWTTLDNALGEVIPWPKEAVALRCITIDVTGTLIAYKGELGDYYCMAAKSVGLPCPDYKHLFQRLFRQDLLVASLFRNFLLVEDAWDMAAEICLSQLSSLIEEPNVEFQIFDCRDKCLLYLVLVNNEMQQPQPMSGIEYRMPLSKQQQVLSSPLSIVLLSISPLSIVLLSISL